MSPGPNAFPRPLRIRSTKDYARAYRQGNRARGGLLLVVACPNGLDHPRLGLSVGRRIWKSAVRRNRVRRMFREAFRLERHALPAGYDFILIPAEPRLEPPLDATRHELVRLARKAVRRCEERRERETRAAEAVAADAVSPESDSSGSASPGSASPGPASSEERPLP